MAARRETERIGAVIYGVLKHATERHNTLSLIRHQWPRWVGKELASHTSPASVRQGRLVVYAERPGDSFALNYRRRVVLERLRTATGGTINELVVRPGGPPTR